MPRCGLLVSGASQVLEDRLHNWGRWARLNRVSQHCGSVEWRYSTMRIRLGEDEEDDRRSPRIKVDIPDAALVEAAWVALPPHQEKHALRLFYVLRVRDPWRICRFVGVENSRDMVPFRELLRRCHVLISRQLVDDHAGSGYNARQQPAARKRDLGADGRHRRLSSKCPD